MSGFSFSRQPLDPAALSASLADVAAGGFVSFEGWVRNENEGREVRRLDYEAFEELALKEGARIVEEALRRFGVRGARCVHRLGELGLGELAVWVGVASGHRAEAFAACRYIIDEVKHRVPIWKKEHYLDGDSGWVNCERCAEAAHAHHDHDHDHGHEHDPVHGQRTPPAAPSAPDYSRQMVLKEVGLAGQRRLAGASVVVVGAGGLGCPVLSYLAGAGVGTLHVVDGDRVEASNLHRQPLFAMSDVGRPKAEVAAEKLAALNPSIRVQAHVTRFTSENAAGLVALGELVVDCSDNFATKFLVNDAAVLAGKPAVMASIYQYEGQLQVARPDAGGSCLRCLWPEATRDGMVGNCAEAGVLGPVPGLFGNLQAMEVLKLLLDLPGQLRDEILLVDLLGLQQHRLRAPRCAECGGGRCARVKGLQPARATQGLELSLRLEEAAAAGYLIVDLREPQETARAPITTVERIEWPVGRLLDEAPGQLDPQARYLLVCSMGVRSRAAAQALRERGLSQVFSLSGGLAAETQRGAARP
jgi:molybdopterin/thiamine biosynthesis adenylyltransferase/molybdopterin synthase catalytic subunit/rhodanese-related sulfurtransferase